MTTVTSSAGSASDRKLIDEILSVQEEIERQLLTENKALKETISHQNRIISELLQVRFVFK